MAEAGGSNFETSHHLRLPPVRTAAAAPPMADGLFPAGEHPLPNKSPLPSIREEGFSCRAAAVQRVLPVRIATNCALLPGSGRHRRYVKFQISSSCLNHFNRLTIENTLYGLTMDNEPQAQEQFKPFALSKASLPSFRANQAIRSAPIVPRCQ